MAFTRSSVVLATTSLAGVALLACVGDSPIERPDGSAPDASVDGALPDGALPDGALPDGALPDGGPILTSCDGGLVDLQIDPKNCGGCGAACPAYDGGVPNFAATCTAAKCGVGCDVGWGDCNSNLGDGCEAPTTQVSQCGACNHVCGSKNASPQCVLTSGAYACKLNCTSGTASCDGDDANGCETSLLTDANNCGACGFSCGSGTCVGGYCRLTATSQDFIFDPPEANAIAVDSAAVYFTQANVAPAGVIRKVPKTGGAVVDVRSPADFGAVLGVSRTVAIDANYIYYLEHSYPRNFLRVPKNGSAVPENLGVLGANGANAVVIALDATTTSATRVFSTQTCNGSGVYAGDIAAKTVAKLADDPGACDGAGRGMAYVNKHLYFGLGYSQQIDVVDYGVSSPTATPFWSTLGCSPFAMASNGANLYVSCSDKLLAFDLPSGTTKTVIASTGVTAGHLVVVGAYVYVVAGGAIYRYGVGEKGQAFDLAHRWGGAAPQGSFRGIVTDGVDLFVHDDKDVYRTHK